jgi:sulfate permease, SulP family
LRRSSNKRPARWRSHYSASSIARAIAARSGQPLDGNREFIG